MQSFDEFFRWRAFSHFRLSTSGPSHHVVTVTTGGGFGVNGFLSGGESISLCQQNS